MLKKVVLSSLLLAVMATPIVAQAHTERNNVSRKNCANLCWLMDVRERQKVNKIENMKKELELKKDPEIIATDNRNFEENRKYANALAYFGGKPDFNENKKRLNLMHDFRLNFINNDIEAQNELLKKEIELTENITRAEWEKYNEICPDTPCPGKYNEKNTLPNENDVEETLKKIKRRLCATMDFCREKPLKCSFLVGIAAAISVAGQFLVDLIGDLIYHGISVYV